MKPFILLTCLIVAISAATNEEELWMKFKEDHLRTYKSFREEKLRFEIFKANLKLIENHNARFAKGDESWAMGINRFADLTREEFEVRYLSKFPNVDRDPSITFVLQPNTSVPDSIDWREKGAVLSIKTEGDGCSSSWASNVAGALEGQKAIKHNIKVDLSPQEILDCSRGYGNNDGCFGGWMDNSYAYVKDHGLETLADYGYKGKDQPCAHQTNSGKINLTAFVDVPKNEESLKEAVGTIGPISNAVNSVSFRFYSHGIFNYRLCDDGVDHGVLTVGYGREGDLDYWIVKNDWGADWGEDGYIRMARNKNNQCGIARFASYPVIE